MREREYDVVVVGAGTAGLAAAYHFARRDLRVALVDARPFATSGARWVNGVPPWMFDAADIPRPRDPELRSEGGRAALYDRAWRRVQTIAPTPIWSCDMRLLVARLHEMAADAGVEGFERSSVSAITCEDQRPRHLTLHPSASGERGALRLGAALFVDAGGVGGGLRRHVPGLAAVCPDVAAGDLCVAAQRVHRIADVEAARRFLAARGADEHDVLTLGGIDGGFSTLVIEFDFESEEVDVLVGTMGDRRQRNPLQLVQSFLGGEAWLGEVLFGGGGTIPLRRPYDQLAVEGCALLGNAGCQVFPAHGSGIGAGMVAARQLADAATAHADPGSAAAMWGYQARFMRSLGAVHAAYDVFRRMTQSLSSEDAEELLGSGLMVASGAQAALMQHMPLLRCREIFQIAKAALGHPRLAARFAPVVARLPWVHAHYQRYPERGDEVALARWARRAARLVGAEPDARTVAAASASAPAAPVAG